MPAGVDVLVEDGFATIDFVDPSKKGPGLAKLLEAGTPPEFIEKLTREKGAPRPLYRVPEGNARLAGLLDKASVVDELDALDTSSAGDATGSVPAEFPTSANLYGQTVRSGSYASEYAQTSNESPDSLGVDVQPPTEVVVDAEVTTGYDDGEPDMDWSRKALDDYAFNVAKIADAADLPNKTAVLEAIRAKK